MLLSLPLAAERNASGMSDGTDQWQLACISCSGLRVQHVHLCSTNDVQLHTHELAVVQCSGT